MQWAGGWFSAGPFCCTDRIRPGWLSPWPWQGTFFCKAGSAQRSNREASCVVIRARDGSRDLSQVPLCALAEIFSATIFGA
jgi:hypothetical protein